MNGTTLVIGLGNPGSDYAHNRHNVGFMVADELADRVDGRFKRHRSGADILEGRLGGQKAVLVKPRSFMNLSGGPVAGVVRFFGVQRCDVVVVHDELDIDFGAIRLKRGGGAGGHNGLRSITKSLGGSDFYRVRVGIGRPPGRMDPATYVLRDFTGQQRKELPLLLDRAADAVEQLISDGLEPTQNHVHTQ